MIGAVLAFAVRQRVLVLVLTLVFVALGAWSAAHVPIDAVPDVTNVQVQILTSAPALGPIDVEANVTTPIERAMAGVPHVEEIRSKTRAGISAVTVVFDDSVSVYFARQLVSERLAVARQAIPKEYGTPELGPIASGLGEIYHFEVKGEGKSLMELRSILDWQIAPRLRMVRGIVDVNTFGGEALTLEARLDPSRLAAARLGVSEVVAAIENNHLAVGGAYFEDGREHVTVRGEGRIFAPEDLENVVLDTRAGTPLFLKDVSRALYAPRPRYGAVTRDGKGEAVVGVVMMLLGANSRDTMHRLKIAVADLEKSLPAGVSIDPYYDRTELVARTITTVEHNLLEASALVVAVLFLTLASLRAGTVVALAIPLALLGVFVGMKVTGIAANLLSLGAIDFGLVVDGAIILVENAQRHLAERREALGRSLTDDERRAVVLEAAHEVRAATAFGEAIIALVYAPILALEGVEGRMFRPMAMTVLFALATAFVLSLTVVPAIASMALRKDTHDRPSPFIRLLDRAYKPALRAVLAVPRTTVLVAFGALVAGLAVFLMLGREFLPKIDEGTIVIPTVRLPSASLAQSKEQSLAMEKTLLEFPEVRSVVSRTGRAEIAVDPMGMNSTDVYVLLAPRDQWRTASDREGLIAAFDKALSTRVPGSGFSYSQPIEMNTNDLLEGIQSDVALHVYGDDLTALQRVGERIVHIFRNVAGAQDARMEILAGASVLAVTLDRAAVARAGLDGKTVLDAVAALGGIEAGTVVDGNRRYPIQVRFAPGVGDSVEGIATLPVRTPHGYVLPLGQLTNIELGTGPSTITRERLQRRVTVQVNVRGRDVASFVEEAKASLARHVTIPPGYSLAWAGEYERLTSASLRLAILLPLTLLLVLVLLLSTFKTAKPAFLIFFNAPMAVTGGIFALALRGMEFSVSAGVGFIALLGVAVLNGLVLVSTIERLRESGWAVPDAVREGSLSRLRPVMTTALVASFGFVPMALSTGAGAEVQRPLATVVVGGVLSSTLVTLLVLPAAYELMHRWRASSPAGPSAESGMESAREEVKEG